jgi:hypothetical protein
MDGDAATACAAVAVPKPAMHKDDFLQSWENQVRLAGEVFAMESKAKA